MSLPPELDALTKSYLEHNRDPQSSAHIRSLLESNDIPSLTACMTPRIAFGTAGLRAKMGPGYACMNALTVIQTSQGLGAYIHSTSSPNPADPPTIVIGRDARHNSSQFARLAASTFSALGFKVAFLDMCHTPLVPFVVDCLNAAAGVMVTASHNPKDDNGYKVYWANGCQIIPPHDRGIAAAITQNLAPRVWDEAAFQNSLAPDDIDALKEVYYDAVVKAAGHMDAETLATFTYTPMHGVGQDIFEAYLQRQGCLRKMHVVQVQAMPDPEFPTVRYPNPEEKGALDQAMRTANLRGDTLILANDPDADRFCVAEKVDGFWKQLRGNQVGVLLATHILEQQQQQQSAADAASQTRFAMLASAVTSRMLARIAEMDKTFDFFETLTGFKWLGNKARDLAEEGYVNLFAYEEALGYMLPDVVFDKDGIAAAAVFLSACQRWQTQGFTPWSKLQSLYKKYGYFEEANTYLRTPTPETTDRVFAAVRAAAPIKVGAYKVTRWIDLTTGYDSGTPDHVALLPIDPGAQMISCELDGGIRFTARGSGTEPKIKLYIEAMAKDRASARGAADSVLQALLTEWFKPEENGLKLP